MEDLLQKEANKPPKKFTVRDLAQGAIIAAVYALLTLFIAPFSSGLIQCRVSEAMSVLPYFTFSAVPGLFIGCVIANLLVGATVYDVVFGSLATLLAAYITYWMRNRVSKYLAPLPSVVVNALVVGWLLTSIYGFDVSFWVAAGYVAIGQAIACFALGIPLMKLLERFRGKLFGEAR
ncbi:MAG TPA: QueT transporter family protein [Clostridia bacterium]|nr:QueT transporter family protein [Clostridia bacterium]